MIGSEKQVKWASEIKASLITTLNKMTEDKMYKGMVAEINDCIAFVERCNEASRFIDYGSEMENALKNENFVRAMTTSIHLSGLNEKNEFSALHAKEKELWG